MKRNGWWVNSSLHFCEVMYLCTLPYAVCSALWTEHVLSLRIGTSLKMVEYPMKFTLQGTYSRMKRSFYDLNQFTEMNLNQFIGIFYGIIQSLNTIYCWLTTISMPSMGSSPPKGVNIEPPMHHPKIESGPLYQSCSSSTYSVSLGRGCCSRWSQWVFSQCGTMADALHRKRHLSSVTEVQDKIHCI